MSNETNVIVEPRKTGNSMIWGVLLILAGLFSIAAPFIAGLAVDALISWLILISGGVHLAHVIHEKGTEGFGFKLLVAILYLLFGIFLIVHPLAVIATLTLVVGIFLLFEGVFEVIHYFAIRKFQHSIWTLVNGIITVILGIMIVSGWPSSALWVVGTFVGISLIFSGLTRLTFSLRSRDEIV